MSHCSLRNQVEALKLLYDLQRNKPGMVTSEDSGLSKQKPQTVAERARESLFSRLVQILSQIISIEQHLIGALSEDPGSLLRHKDSVDLRNICLRMAMNEAGSQSDRDLRELRVCLQLIVDNLLSAVRDENSLSSLGVVRSLVGISTIFPDL